MATIYPSLLAANILNLQHDIERLDPYCAGYQLDIMDGQFVPIMSCGPAYINAVAGATYKKIWVHLMVNDPMSWLGAMFLPAGSIVSFHFESKSDIAETIKAIQEKNWMPSLAINPKTPVEKTFPFLATLYQVLVLSVQPGYAGQEFIAETWDKLRPLVGYRETSKLSFRIGVDGGIKAHNIVELVRMGIDDCVVASAIFDDDDPAEALKELTLLAQLSE